MIESHESFESIELDPIVEVTVNNLVFFLRGRQCVGVSNLETGELLRNHPCWGHRLKAVVVVRNKRFSYEQEVVQGGYLFFRIDGTHYMTPPISRVTRGV